MYDPPSPTAHNECNIIYIDTTLTEPVDIILIYSVKVHSHSQTIQEPSGNIREYNIRKVLCLQHTSNLVAFSIIEGSSYCSWSWPVWATSPIPAADSSWSTLTAAGLLLLFGLCGSSLVTERWCLFKWTVTPTVSEENIQYRIRSLYSIIHSIITQYTMSPIIYCQ